MTKTEEMWRKVLQNVAYKEWAGEEIKIVNEKTGEAENESSAEKLDVDSDGIVLSNIDENTTEETIRELLRKEADVQEEGVVIESTNNGKSRLITGLSKSVVNDLTKKLNKKVIDGKMIHCKARVPSTPPKMSAPELEKSKEEHGEDDSQLELGTKSIIPGLSPMSRNQKKKQKKKNKKTESPSKVDDLKSADFLLCKNLGKKVSSLSIMDEEVNDFDFSGDESKSDENETNERHGNACKTPLKLSDFVEDEKLVSVPNLPNKRCRTSPNENTESKKTRASSNGSLGKKLSC